MDNKPKASFVVAAIIAAVVTAAVAVGCGSRADRKTESRAAGAEAFLANLDRIQGAGGLDLSAMDLSGVPAAALAEIGFDDATKWPPADKLPAAFSAEAWLATAKGHGSAMDRLHERGITGQGVAIAVIDKPINSTHTEFGARLTYIEVDGLWGGFATTHFHGLACASVIAGGSCGVAPEAALYYFAVPDNGRNIKNYMAAIDQMIQLNRGLDEKSKIRLVSVSDGLNEQSGPLWEEWQAAVARAAAEGIDVNYSNGLQRWRLTYGGCPPYADRDESDAYALSAMLKGRGSFSGSVLIPSDYRTTADNRADDAYRYWAAGGFSWAIAYVSGLAALAYQVNPDLRYDDIVDLIYATRQPERNGLGLIDPARFIAAAAEIRPSR